MLRAAFWALGEIGGPAAEAALLDADASGAWSDTDLGAVIGGALKKIRGGTVRAFAGNVAKRLLPPPTDNVEVAALVDELAVLDSSTSLEDVVKLREHLQALDPEYFTRYMKCIAERPSVERILQSGAIYRPRS